MWSIYEDVTITPWKRYELFADVLIQSARVHGRAVYAVPGNVFVFETSPWFVVQRCQSEGIELEIVPGISALEAMYAEARVEPKDGIQVLDAAPLQHGAEFSSSLNTFILQVWGDGVEALVENLRRKFPDDHPVALIEGAGYSASPKEHPRIPLGRLAAELSPEAMEAAGRRYELLTLYVPPIGGSQWNQHPEIPSDKRIMRAPHLAQSTLEDGTLVIVPVRRFHRMLDKVTLDTPARVKLWMLLAEPRTAGELRIAMDSVLATGEHLEHLLDWFNDAELICEAPPVERSRA